MYDIAEGGFDRDLATPKKTKARAVMPEPRLHRRSRRRRALMHVMRRSLGFAAAHAVAALRCGAGSRASRPTTSSGASRSASCSARRRARTTTSGRASSPAICRATCPAIRRVIVQNMPGAGQMLATNWLYNVAPRDGTVWGSVSRNIPNAGLQSCAGVPLRSAQVQLARQPGADQPRLLRHGRTRDGARRPRTCSSMS